MKETFCPEETLGHKFRMINNLIDRAMELGKRAEGNTLTRAQCSIIHFLSVSGDEIVYQKDIESTFHISGATASNMLKGMEKNGYIKRISSNSDGRLKRIILTEKAVKQEQNARINIERMERQLTKGMSEEQCQLLHRALSDILDNLTELKPEKQSP